MSPRKSVQHELSREMIMNAARELFITKGYQHVSMRQVAKELGYSHGAIYYHFKNKAELFYALVEEHFHMLDQVLDRILEEELDTLEKLKKVMLGFIEFGLTYQSHYEIMFLIKEEEVINYINQGPNKSYEKFAQTVHMLCGRQTTIQEIWSIFLSLHGFVTHYLRHVTSFEDVRELAHLHVNFLLKAML
ncbi:TetR/AcrR family transcriptional regulator [Heyndrickxia oleronia]|uniref:TetR/AcrR family transcriptional regulator n=1 Tax=Heyndrickxia oleronia TaxID=38875 RepID=UPI00039F12E2|nr:TetR/AcrR family transcriptional regulator [Heyndrickxia oleronia]MCM3454028.1 TetR/AcrR family transcriptional regulator [Heyndrickxia oleronia]NYV66446.1 TetR/AcrR family transcriptional regulator [Bacillus sp. Gen3]